jgi:hypothetical protein
MKERPLLKVFQTGKNFPWIGDENTAVSKAVEAA